MSNAKKSISRRFMAALLSFVLVLGLIPTSALTAYAATPEHPNGVTVSVTDQDGKGIAGATVEYHINSTVNGADYASGTATTDETGCAEVLTADKFIADDLTLSATAVLADYTYADGSGRIENAAITSDAQDFAIQLRSTKIPGVTVTANSGLVYQEGTAQSLVTVAGTKGTDTVTYKIDNDVVVTPQKTDAGTYAVEVIVAREGYSDFVFSENVTIAKASIAGIDITEVNASYNEKTQNIATLTGNFLPTDEVHWFVNGTDTGSMDVPQKDAVGEYTVRLTVDRGNNYEAFDKTVTSKIVLGNINLDGLKITANKLTYNGDKQEAVTVEGQGNYTLQYRLSETESWKKYDKAAGTVPTVKNAGDYTVYIKAVKDSYNDKEYPEFPLNVHVEKAEQTLAFNNYTEVGGTDQISGEVPYGKTYDFSATDVTTLAGGSISYEITTDEDDIASINENTGLLTVNYPGVITVKAILTGNENYSDCTIEYRLEVSGAVAEEGNYIYFTSGQVDYVLGVSDIVSTQTALKRSNRIRGTIRYSIDPNYGLTIGRNGTVTVSDYDKLADSIRSTTDGILKLTVTATKERARGYDEDTAKYVIAIKFEETPSEPYTLSPEEADGTNGWYKSSVTVTPKEGYEIAQAVSSVFGATTAFSNQGTDVRYVYLRNTVTQGITDRIALNVKIDTVEPDTSKMKMSYSESVLDKVLSTITFGYYNPDVTVTFTAEDETSGLAYLDWKYTKEANASDVNLTDESGHITSFDKNGQAVLTLTASEVKKQYRGNISFTVTDKAGNTSDVKTDDDHVIVIDTIAPNCSVSYADPLNSHDGKKYFDGSIELSFTVTEANFYEEDFKAFVSKNGESKAPVSLSWKKSTEEKDTYIGTYMLSGDGDYVVSAEYKDRSNNEMAKYQSDVLVIDTRPANITHSFTEGEQGTAGTLTLVVEEHNFDATCVSFENSESIKAKITDISGAQVEQYATQCAKLFQSLRKKDNWAVDEDNPDKYTFTFTDWIDGLYELTFSYTDFSGHKAVADDACKFTVDKTAPSIPEISYSESHLDTVLSGITFGFYNPDVTVTFTSYDAFAGVDYFTWSYVKQKDASNTNVAAYKEATLSALQDSSDKSKYTATVTLPLNEAEQLRGSISALATDKHKIASDKVTDNGEIIVVDTIAPTMNVEYSEASNQVGTTLYYGNDKSGKAEITFKVTEANFFAEDVVVKVSKNGATAYAVTPAWTDVDADTHIGSYTISGDGHYIVSVEYTDRSNNKMTTYQSDMITIDTIKPQVNVTYQNTAKITTLKDSEGAGRDYFNKTQTAVVTINEHNFDSNDVKFNIVGKDVAGNMRNISDLISMSSWRTNGDVHSITIAYSGDANYTFDVDYSDLAKNAAEDYAADHFTVDTVAPRIAGVSYSTSVLERVLSSVSFGFYNAKMTVTVTAEDDTAGVHQFNYSYLTAAGVSSVNAQLLDQVIDEAGIKYSDGGRTATMTFEIPKMALGSDNQFNGTVKFDATDRSDNKVEQSENKRIVVDNIAPTATVSYNEPVNTQNGISYYDGNINGTITINEANFYAEDVSVMVSRDGGAAQTLVTSWSDSSVDTHIGSFTLTDDADYIVTINYRDKSGNTMTEYQSSQMTIDTKIEEPTYSINGVAKSGDDGGAYKDEANISFNFEDQNFDTQTVKLVRTRFNETKDVTADFVKVGLNEKGGSGSFDIAKKVDNDGIYVLTVTMTDKAGHSTESHIKFTINRYGSVYEYSDYLTSLIKDGGQYIAKNGDAAITDDLVITEYNADRIVKGSLKIVITRDGETIDTKFTASPEASDNTAIGSSGWYQYVYTISKENFTEDGVYNITITSEDATGNTSTSVPDNSVAANGEKILDVMTFTVDTTAPEIRNIVGLDKKIVNAQEQNVKYTIVDVGGLKQIEVIVNGQTADTITDFGDDLNSYAGTFTLSESNEAQTVQLKVTDLAGNVTDTASDDFNPGERFVFNDVITVSTNFFVRWYANTPLFWGSIGGVVVVTAGIWLLIVAKRKKKAEEK